MTNPTSWTCPNCRRRVPRYATVCHCGTRRDDASAIEAAPARAARARGAGWRQWPLSVWVPLVIAALAAITLIVLLFVPPPPRLGIPLLGRVDRVPTPQAHPRR